MSKFQIVFEAVTGNVERGLRKVAVEGDKTTTSLKKTEKASLDVREAALKVEAAEQRAARATQRFGKESLQAQQASVKLERAQDNLNKTSGRSARTMKAMADTAKVAAGAVAGFAAVDFLKDSVKAAADAEASQVRVQTMLKNAGISWEKHGEQIDKVIQKHSQLTGIDDEELAESFANMVRTTGDVTESLKLNALAADISRTKGLGLAQAQSLLARVYNGSFTGLKKLGVAIEPVTAAQDKLKAGTEKATDAQKKAAKQADEVATRQRALALLQKSFGGQAEEFGKTSAGAADRLGVAWENLQETAGAKLAPALASVATVAANFFDELQTGEGTGGDVARVFGNVADGVRNVGSTIGPVIGDVTELGVNFLSSEAGMVAMSAAAGGLAGRLAGLGIAAVVTQVGGLVAAARAAGGGMAALSAAISRNPIGLVATGIGLLAGAYIGLSRNQQQATTSSQQLTDALNAQTDAARRLADFDLDAAQRKATLKGANAQLAAAERELAEARKAGDPIRLKQAEAGLEQSRIAVKRATRDVNRTETDRKRATEESASADRKAASTAQKRVDTLRGQISALREGLKWADRLGWSTKQVAAVEAEAASKTRQLNRELARLPEHTRLKIDVEFGGVALNTVKNSIDGVLDAIDRAKGRRRGGEIAGFAAGGMVPAMVSPGELLAFGDRAAVVPGARTAADSVFTMLPVGTQVFTDHGQQLLAAGASRGEALTMQAPHFATGGGVGRKGKVTYGPGYTGSAYAAGLAAGESGASSVRDTLGEILTGVAGNRDAAPKDSKKATGGDSEAGGFAKYGLDANQAARARRMLGTATSIARRGEPYKYGVNDCSWYVSRILSAGGIGNGRMVVAQGTGLYTWGRPGQGKYATWGVRGTSDRNAHTMIRLGSRYFESGGGHGPAEVRGWNGAYQFRHVPGFRSGTAAAGLTGWGQPLRKSPSSAVSLESMISRILKPAATAGEAIKRAFEKFADRLADSKRVSDKALERIIARAEDRAEKARKRGDTSTARRQDAIANTARAEQGRRVTAGVTAATDKISKAEAALARQQRIAGIDPSSSKGIGQALALNETSITKLGDQRTKLTKALSLARKRKDKTAIKEITESLETIDEQLAERAATAAELKRAMRFSAFEERMGAADTALTIAQVLTPGDTTDDRKAIEDKLAAATEGFNAAMAAGDQEGIQKFGPEIINLRNAIESLDDTISTQTDLQQMLVDLLKQSAENQQKLINLAEYETSALTAAIIQSVNGGIGETVSLAGKTPMFPGSGARY